MRHHESAGRAAGEPSRSLLLGRISRLHDEQMPITGARIEAGRTRCVTDARGTYCLPLDALELPFRLRVTAPGYFTCSEVIDWSPIMSGGMLVRDFQLVEDRRWLEPAVASEPLAMDGVVGVEEGLEESIEVVSLPAAEEDEDRPDFSGLTGLALETASRSGRAAERARGEKGQEGPDLPEGTQPARATALSFQELGALGGGLEAGSFIPTESLPQSSSTLGEELTALVESLAEQDISMLGAWSPTGPDAGLEPGAVLSDAVVVVEEGVGNPAEATLEDDEVMLEADEVEAEADEVVPEADEVEAEADEVVPEADGGETEAGEVVRELEACERVPGNAGAAGLQASGHVKPSTRPGASRRLESGEDSWYYDSGEWEDDELPASVRRSPGKGIDKTRVPGRSDRPSPPASGRSPKGAAPRPA